MSIMMRPDSGTQTRAANQRDVNKHINELQQELTRSRAETQRARDKLNCLISLVRRSWNGDRNASIHLANIIGLDIPPFLLDTGTAGRPGTRMQAPSISDKTLAVVNWERLTVKLLQRDYDLMQREIQEQQQRYIENRSRYMDEVMHFHQQDMCRVPLSRPSSAKMSSVDQKFLQIHSMVRSDGRNEGRQRLHRPKSTAVRARPKVDRDLVQQAEVKLRDLFVESSSPSTVPSTMAAADASLRGTRETESTKPRYIRQEYDDSTRYAKGNLFTAEDMLSKKPRPMSAAIMREKDRLRARPRSAVTITVDGAAADESSGDRPLKYETTRPLSKKKPASAKARKTSTSSTDASQSASDVNANNSSIQQNNNNSFTEHMLEEQEDAGDPVVAQPPISVRVKNAISRPECVDKFSEDLRSMEEMEAMFKMKTLALQKKLGLPENGIV